MSSEYDEGFQAFLDGESLEDNRYSPNAGSWFDGWIEGWNAAKEAAEKGELK